MHCRITQCAVRSTQPIGPASLHRNLIEQDRRDVSRERLVVVVITGDSARRLSGGGGGSVGTAWTEEDDDLLRQLVDDSGSGNWEKKAANFDTYRSGNSLSHRYRKLLVGIVDAE